MRSIEIGAADCGVHAATQELVAGGRDHVRARLDARAGGRLVERLHERPGAEVVHEWEPVPVREPCEVADARVLGEADDAKFD